MFRVKGELVDLRDALPAAREEAGLSQQSLANLLGVSERSIQWWEHGRTPQIRLRPLIQAFLDDPAEFRRLHRRKSALAEEVAA